MEQNTSSTTQVPSTNGPAPHKEPGSPFKNKKLLIGLGAVAFLLVASIVVAVLASGGKKSPAASDTQPTQQTQAPAANTSDRFTEQYLRNCNKDRKVTFTQTPVPLNQLGYFEPMGRVFDGHITPTDHVYLNPLNPRAADNTTDVVMPADGTVISVGAMPSQYIGDNNVQTAKEDHRIVIAHNCQYVSILIHVHALSDKLKAVVGTLQPNAVKDVSIEMLAGEPLGKIGGSSMDWSLMDASKTLPGFITPSLYEGEPWKIHTIDPVSVYQGPLKDQVIAKSLRSSEPYGGKIDYDKKGALMGNWFREGTNGYAGSDPQRYYDGHLAIAPNHIDASALMISFGNWQGKSTQFVAKSGYADPNTVTTASNPAKYELIDLAMTADGQHYSGSGLSKNIKVNQTGTVRGTVMFQVLDGEKLKVELFPGKTADQVTEFTAAAQTYVR